MLKAILAIVLPTLTFLFIVYVSLCDILALKPF